MKKRAQNIRKKHVGYGGLIVALLVTGVISGQQGARSSSFDSAADGDTLVVGEQSISQSTVSLRAVPLQYAIPHISQDLPVPWLSTRAYAVIDEQTGVVLQAGTDQSARPIASLTKLMTALVSVEKGNMPQPVRIMRGYPDLPSSRLGVRGGDTFYLRDLLAALLINSSNDVAAALPDSLTDDSPAVFIDWMNQKAQELGMTQSRFGNTIGLDDGRTYAPAQEMALLARAAMSHEVIRDIVSIDEMTIADVSGERVYHLNSTNALLNDIDFAVSGIKTGKTPEAGECLITRAMIHGHPIITVVLNSDNRFADTKSLLSWTRDSINWR